jgi:uncharacterized repeat protein (TIGR01451 family)
VIDADRQGRARKARRMWVVVVAVTASLLGASGASGASTAISSFSKSGTDAATGSTVQSGGAAGNTNAGDTINWVLGYENKTSGNANVSIADPVGPNQTYVSGSLHVPPGLSPQWSTAGSSWQSTEPASGVAAVGATGTSGPGLSAASGPFTTSALSFHTSGGDGYSVEGQGSNVYTVFHHTTGGTPLFCATLSGTYCAGWPKPPPPSTAPVSTYASTTAGDPLGTGPEGVVTAGINGSFIVDGNLYYAVEATTAVAGRYEVGVMCVNLTAAKSCGFIGLDSVAFLGGTGGAIATDGIQASDGNYYMFDEAGNMLCFAPSASGGAGCGVVSAQGTRPSGDAGYFAEFMTVGQYIYFTYQEQVSDHEIFGCYDVVAKTECPGGFPFDQGAPVTPGFPDVLLPALSSTGALIAGCDLPVGQCRTPTGTVLAKNPWVGTANFGYPSIAAGFGTPAIVGSKVYLGFSGNIAVPDNIYCFDFALPPLPSGRVAQCSGFATTTTDLRNYTVRALANLPGCMAADGDGAQIVIFNAVTGGACTSGTTQVKITPASYYCDGASGHAKTWGTLALNGLTGSEYAGASVTLLDANGTPVPGFANLALASGHTSLDLSSLPASGNTATLTAQVTLAGVSDIATVQKATITLAWSGDPEQVCFQTKVGPSVCQPAPVITNDATAVTDGGAGASDAPGGNDAGTVTFNEAPDTSQCMPTDSILKIADAANGNKTPVTKGEKVYYSYLVTNTGNVDIASFSVSDPTVSGVTCPTPAAPGLAPGHSEKCTANAPYIVTQHDVDSGGTNDIATVACTDRYGQPCTPSNPSKTHIPSSPAPAVSIDKTGTVTPGADQNGAKVGDSIQYKYTVTNIGNVDEPTVTVSDPTDGTVVCPVPSPPGLAPGASETCTAVKTHTVTQADVDAGQIVDTATAGCKDTLGEACPPSNVAKVVIDTVNAMPSTSIQKIANASTGDQTPITVGETIQYSYYVTNTGNVTIKSVSVTDPTGGAVTCPTPSAPGLAPGHSVTCKGNTPYTVTQTDVNAGSVTDTATSGCTDVRGDQCPPPPPSKVTVPGNPDPKVGIDKAGTVTPSADQGDLKVGDTIAYTYTVTNIGNTDLTTLSVSDPTIGAVTCPAPAAPGLLPGASETCTANNTYKVKQTDIDRGMVTDTATAGCVDAGGRTCGPSNKSMVTILTDPASPLTKVVKTATVSPKSDQHHARAGDEIRYTFTVTNVGNVDLVTVSVTDSKLGPVSCPVPQAPGLAPGASETCAGTRVHTVGRADLRAKQVVNVAVSTGTDPNGQVSAVSQQAMATVPTIAGGLTLAKVASVRTATVGEHVTYTLKVTNHGSGAIAHVKVCDSIPRGLLFLSSKPKAALNTGSRCWAIKKLGGHGTRVLRITVIVAPGAGKTATNHATAGAPGHSTARARATIHIRPAPPVICPSARDKIGTAHAAC